MNAFSAYSIPIKGLKTGLHTFSFSADSAFFALFEDSPVETGKIDFQVTLDKRSDMLLFDFDLSGFIETECDRCMAVIKLPIKDFRQLIAKYGNAEGETEDEVVFIHPESSAFNIAKYLYEFAVLALPISNVYDCQDEPNPPCNFEVLKHLTSDSEQKQGPNVWDNLKDLKDN